MSLVPSWVKRALVDVRARAMDLPRSRRQISVEPLLPHLDQNLTHSMVVRNGLRLIAPIKSEYHSLKEAPVSGLASRSSLASPETSRLAEAGVNCTALRVWLDFVGRGWRGSSLTKLSASSAFGRESNRKREGEGGWRGHATRTLAHVVPKAWMSSPEAQRLEAGARGYTTLLAEGIPTFYAKGAWSSDTNAIANARPSTGSSPDATLPLKKGALAGYAVWRLECSERWFSTVAKRIIEGRTRTVLDNRERINDSDERLQAACVDYPAFIFGSVQAPSHEFVIAELLRPINIQAFTWSVQRNPGVPLREGTGMEVVVRGEEKEFYLLIWVFVGIGYIANADTVEYTLTNQRRRYSEGPIQAIIQKSVVICGVGSDAVGVCVYERLTNNPGAWPRRKKLALLTRAGRSELELGKTILKSKQSKAGCDSKANQDLVYTRRPLILTSLWSLSRPIDPGSIAFPLSNAETHPVVGVALALTGANACRVRHVQTPLLEPPDDTQTRQRRPPRDIQPPTRQHRLHARHPARPRASSISPPSQFLVGGHQPNALSKSPEYQPHDWKLLQPVPIQSRVVERVDGYLVFAAIPNVEQVALVLEPQPDVRRVVPHAASAAISERGAAPSNVADGISGSIEAEGGERYE
ncbi:hypothetical protein FA13DRAFT_1718083 [Coprinellus micaceus]|uniref:Uncharacterized protein n=1 Tax=Coprinellus micaceus TaxID=71717 RepID=A0A4Y7SEY1_COPMI|nr:hypothetical protein FA13DRAFT_1718083 [Coprinellus micaceus]